MAGGTYVQSHAAEDLEAYADRGQWLMANPSLDAMPELERVIAAEAEGAGQDPALMAAFRALRLNGGVSDIANRDLVVMPQVWTRCLYAAEAEPTGKTCWGLDLGSAHALSAVACCWETGRLETLAMFGKEPLLKERAASDGSGDLYSLCLLYTSPSPRDS